VPKRPRHRRAFNVREWLAHHARLRRPDVEQPDCLPNCMRDLDRLRERLAALELQGAEREGDVVDIDERATKALGRADKAAEDVNALGQKVRDIAAVAERLRVIVVGEGLTEEGGIRADTRSMQSEIKTLVESIRKRDKWAAAIVGAAVLAMNSTFLGEIVKGIFSKGLP
jgi:hypothetical protein